jgi:hypothetical protein
MKYFSFFVLLAIRIVVYPPQSASQVDPFTSPASIRLHELKVPVTLLSFEGKLNSKKVLLNWVVSENQTADKFEVEKSEDGIHFRLTALVFGTDKPDNCSYAFYEHATGKKVSYRIKVIGKNQEAIYSPVIEIEPHVG